MLRHAEMPKGSRRVPTVKDGFILGPPHGVSGRLLLAHGSWSLAVGQALSLLFLLSARPPNFVIRSEVRRKPNAVEGPRVCRGRHRPADIFTTASAIPVFRSRTDSC